MRRAYLLLIPLALASAFGVRALLTGSSSGSGEEPGARPLPLGTRAEVAPRPETAATPAVPQAGEAAGGRAVAAEAAATGAREREEAARAALAKGDAKPAEDLVREDAAGSRSPSRVALAREAADLRKAQGDLPGATAVLVRQLEAMATAKAPYLEMRPAADRLDGFNRELLFNPSGAYRSESVVVVKNDSWHLLAKKFAAAKGVAHGVGLLRAVNRKSGDHLVPGETLRIPLDPVRIVVHRDSFAAFVYLGAEIVRVYPIGIGREDAETPAGRFVIGTKEKDPVWWKPKPPIPAGDPRNPLGARWLGFRADGRSIPYGIHGTERDDAVGGRISEGCIRLHNRDVVELYDLVPDSGTSVEVF